MTYSRSRSPITAARTVRETTGVNSAPMAMMMIAVPLPSSDRIRIEVMMIGSASRTSISRMMTSSVSPSVEARDEADDAAPQEGEKGGQRRDEEHGAGAGHGAGQHVAPELVGAEPVRRAGRLERYARVGRRGALRDERREERHEDPEDHDDEAGHERRAAKQGLDQVAPLASLLECGGGVCLQLLRPEVAVGGKIASTASAAASARSSSISGSAPSSMPSARRSGSEPYGLRGLVHLSRPCGSAG